MSVKAELAFDVCWEVYRGARDVLETKRGVAALDWTQDSKYLWRPDLRRRHRPEGRPLQDTKGCAEAEEFAGFGGGHAGVGGETVEVVEAVAGGPGRERGFA